jgi:ATP-binding cassette subfamily B protein
VARLGEAIEALARLANLLPGSVPALSATLSAPAPRVYADDDAREQWVESVAQHLSIEAEPVEAKYADVDAFVCGVAPAIVGISDGGSQMADSSETETGRSGIEDRKSKIQNLPRFLVLLKGGNRVTLLAPNLSQQKIAAPVLRDTLCREVETPFSETTEQMLIQAGVAPERRARVRRTILAQRLSTVSVARGWILRLSPSTADWRQLRHTRIIPLTAIILGVNLLQQLLTIAGWGIIGGDVLQGRFDWARLWAWALLTLMGIPLQMLAAYVGARLGTNVGSTFKTRLLYGALKLEPEEIRHEGAGQFLSRIMDAGVVEYGSIANGLTFIFAVLQIFTAMGVLALGVGGWVSVALLAVFILGTIALGWILWNNYNAYEDAYRAMTNHLVERMVGYRTRLAQADMALWHSEEDAELARYAEWAERQARLGNWLAVLPRAWMIVGIASVAGALVAQTIPSVQIAISLGGVLLAEQALVAIIANIHSFVALAQSWCQIKPLFAAARRPSDLGFMISDLGFRNSSSQLKVDAPNPKSEIPSQKSKIESPLVTLRDVSFRYRDRGRFALNHVELSVADGDRLLIEGPSGGGKSTLAAVVAGLRVPESGLVLLRGYDRASVGLEARRRRVVIAPQFHENHAFTGTFGFNLLMGRRRPPTPEDAAEAQNLCAELGLGELLARMPSGMQQMVGESGWQLSHGERSRLYIARALLQRADLIILDESFAALDPANLARALTCVLKRAPALAVIAHP